MSEQPFSHSPHVNPGLARDRAALLSPADVLAGSAHLNWNENLAMNEWQGVVLKGSPPRVTELDLRSSRLTGRIPAEVGLLTNLRGLNLAGNHLTDVIPPELGDLTSLRRLNFQGNRLAGAIPPELEDSET